MKIIVQDHLIETKEIVSIHEVEKFKKSFRNREAGFVITMIDGTKYQFKEDIDYETTSYGISSIKSRWSDRMKKVVELWEQDKHEYPTIQW